MRIFSYHKYDGYLWCRLFGYGLHFVDRSKHKPLFSVRNGHIKEYSLGKNWKFKFLKGNTDY